MNKKKLTIRIVCLIVFLTATNMQAQLSGEYSIGNGGDFSSISEAVDSLNNVGRGGPITFVILDGTYKEQFTIESHPGMSTDKPVVFKSESGNAEAVKIAFESTSSADNFIVKLQSVSYITFQDLTFTSAGNDFGTIVLFSGASLGDISFLNNVFNGVNTSSGSSVFNIIHANSVVTFGAVISGNTFVNGSKAIYMSSGGVSSGTIISNNTISGCQSNAIHLESHLSPIVSENDINHSGQSYAIYLSGCQENLEVTKNKINVSDQGRVGIYLDGCEGSTQEQDRGLIANNFITVGYFDGGRSGIQITNSTKQDVFYNSIYIVNPNSGSQAFYLGSNCGDINIINNSFSNVGQSLPSNLTGGRAIVIKDPNDVSIMSNNNIFSVGNYFAEWGNDNFLDLEELISSSGKNANSISVFPHYISSSNLHTISPYLDGAAAALTRITEDLDGESRNGSAPDIGADEFTPDPDSKIPLSGTYTIGSGGDYSSFTEAAADLLLKGTSSPIVFFDVIPGEYNENLALFQFPKEGESHIAVFRSQTRDPQDVTLFYEATGTSDNYVVNLRGAKNIHFKDLTFSARSSSTAQAVFVMQGYNENIVIEGSLISSSQTGSSGPQNAVISAVQSLTKNIVISDNTITGGSYGVYISGINSNLNLIDSSVVVESNSFSISGGAAISLDEQWAPIVGKNSTTPGSSGIFLDDCEGPFEVIKNMVDVNGTDWGIYLAGCNGDPLADGSRGIVANNFVTHRGGNNITRGAVEIVESNSLDVVYNSVNSESPLSPSLHMYASNQDINVINNLLINTGNGYAYKVESPSAITTSDYNDIYTTGEKFAFWNGDKANLSELQAASGKDSNSISVDPGFFSINNLHINVKSLDSAGKSIPSVLFDIDGDARDNNNPDIGADEFIFAPNSPPSFTSNPDTSASVDLLYEYQVTIEDVDNDSITFNLTTAPGFLSIDGKTGLLQGTPSSSDTGKHPVEIVADDNRGNQTKQSFTLSVDITTAINSASDQIPDKYFISQNYPNPFNPSTIISYQLPEGGHVTLKVYDVLGNEVTTLVNEVKPAGYYEVEFNASSAGGELSSGIYFYRIQAGSFNQVKKMILLR